MLNINKSTSQAHRSVHAILVEYFAAGMKNLWIDHFASLELSDVWANGIYKELSHLIDGN